MEAYCDLQSTDHKEKEREMEFFFFKLKKKSFFPLYVLFDGKQRGPKKKNCIKKNQINKGKK